MIKTVDNFDSNYSIKNDTKSGFSFGNINKNYYLNSSKQESTFIVTLSDFLNKRAEENKIFSFFESNEPKQPEKEIIISVKKDDENYQVQTGNYIGKFRYNNIDIEINSRFNNVFLKRMLNFANDVYLDDVDVAGENTKENFDISKFILYYLFIQKLEKAFLLGLPKAYTTIKHHDINLKGNVDINRFIKKDIPFKGKISSKSRDQVEVEEIIDILHKAVNIIDKSSFSTKNISHIKTHLKQHRSKNFVSNQTFQKALNHKALNNPIFSPYKEILKLAKYIVDQDNLEEKESGRLQTYGFLVDVASLFEIYLIKLLKLHFNDWEIIHEEKLLVYEDLFYRRHMYPDIVMKKDKKVIVLDAKYKRMFFRGRDNSGLGDLDRSDFFQIHTYISYYKNQKYDVIAGGLLYPIEANTENKTNTRSDDCLGDNQTKFIVDGIHLSNVHNISTLLKAEERFIDTIKSIVLNNNITTEN